MTVAAVATLSYGLASTVAHADEPAPTTGITEATGITETTDSTVTIDSTVPTGEVDGAIVAVDVPPVPPTSIEVAVGEPPVPPTSVVVAVDEPPVPPVTMPDATPIVASHALAPAVEAQLPETGAAAARATAIVAGAAVSIGAALRALAQRP